MTVTELIKLSKIYPSGTVGAWRAVRTVYGSGKPAKNETLLVNIMALGMFGYGCAGVETG